MVGGRTVEVDLALSQDDARNLASGGRASSGPGKDNRNLYLVPTSYIPLLALFAYAHLLLRYVLRQKAATCSLAEHRLAPVSHALSQLP